MSNLGPAPRFIRVSTAARRLGLRDQMAALELLRPAEADIRRGWDGALIVAEADVDALASII